MDTKKLRQKILDLAIRGKLVPQDPNDEPASVLLERIKAEKEQLIKDGKIKRSKKSASSDTSPYENVPFEIPENWAWCKPSDVFIINHRNNAEDTIEVGFVPMPLIKDGYHYQHSYESVLWKTVKTGYTHFTNGDFGLAKITPCFENRKSVIFNNLPNGIGAGTTELHILRPIMIDVKYVSYFYSSEEFISYGIKNFSGAVGQQRISKEVIEDFGFALPPQKEQNRIIEAVEKWFSIIDQLEQEQTDLKNAIKRAKSKILDLAIHGKLVPQDPNDEPAIDLLRRINPSFKPCDNAHYKNLPSGWSICRLEDIVDYEQPQAYIVDSTDYSEDYPTPVLTAGKSFIIGYTNETDGICDNLPVIIFDDFTTDSRFVDFPFKIKSSVMKILRVKKEIDIRYVGFYMSITRLVGDTHKRYWISEYSKLPILIPPKAEQERIVQTVTDLLGKLDNIIAEL